jgi:hypothetical protein
MPVTPLPIANGFYQSDSLPISAQECTNWYPNIVQTDGLNRETLFGTPGISQLTTTGEIDQVNRGRWLLNKIPYFVNGDGLYRIERTITGDLETFTNVKVGTIEGTGRVSIADNGTQMCVLVPGGKGYIFTTDPDTFTEITDSDFRANGDPQYVVYLDGYFVFTTDSKKFIISALNDGLNYNAVDFGTAEADPDDIVAPLVFKNQLFIGGTQTLEAFQNIGGGDFPFQRTGRFIEVGISAPFSVAKINQTTMFIGAGENESPAIWQLTAGSVEKVSTTAIDSILQTFTDDEINEAFAQSYAEKGAYFIGFFLPTTALFIDTITGRWHERKSQVVDAKGVTQTIRSRVNSILEAYGRIMVADSQDGRIGEMSKDIYTEYGRNIIRRVATQPFQNNMRPIFLPYLELTTESGVGNDEVEEPKIRLDISENGGKTFKQDRTRNMGKKGEYSRRTIWRRLGRVSRFVIFRFTLSDAVKPVIIQLTNEVEGGAR